ncbi:DUF6913 domain-containing protein [Flavobacterium muglaense]|uniref:Uncharacterized protein n=1 Tax=Flavobacterium muglaense TaxID=2764716 RepID=A0A923SFJ4_9FLAO|nr:hypothetical protein [Flavobacterium muglaense]MBC5837991.1 hypothetical protein [Flavobacterium muglaense]MBC5844525.1 hypothetical protein [Flavobacterium muglaense]
MFLNYIKEFIVKKSIKKRLLNVKTSLESGVVKKVGLIIDERYFSKADLVIQELLKNGILEQNLEVLFYKDRWKKSDSIAKIKCSAQDLNWNGSLSGATLNNFINNDFDLLISYYDVEKAILMVVTQESKARFKVGFPKVEKGLNDLLINITTENHSVFTQELFRYLKILNKI